MQFGPFVLMCFEALNQIGPLQKNADWPFFLRAVDLCFDQPFNFEVRPYVLMMVLLHSS